eukprot:TRINITY_DN46764_c0_g1_i1.p1 TRINITY_DN46764_c0_g1~~TRINITY_DN46764_c0_g1_i1.p1  ORF type:complete len:430 (+),score=174.23 TRINITY_DN46764_c0_g1_i1:95-1291(+)
MAVVVPSPPASAPPADQHRRESLMSREEQTRAVAEMEATAADLAEIVNATEEMREEQGDQLQRFESGVRELNQLNALKRASVISDQYQEAEKRGGWHSSLSDKVERRASAASQCRDEEDAEDSSAQKVQVGMIGYYGGATVRRCSSARRVSASTPTPAVCNDVAAFQEDAADGWGRRTSATEGLHIVGSLTPALLKARRSSAGSRRSSTVSQGLVRGQSAKRLSITEGAGLSDAVAVDVTPRETPFAPAGLPPRPGDAHAFPARGSLLRRASADSGVSGRRSSQQDTSSTRVTGKIDYTALLSEQQDDFAARAESSEKYKAMLGQVENYQRKMLEHLDSQLVFMGITDAQVERTAQELAEQAAAVQTDRRDSELTEQERLRRESQLAKEKLKAEFFAI